MVGDVSDLNFADVIDRPLPSTVGSILINAADHRPLKWGGHNHEQWHRIMTMRMLAAPFHVPAAIQQMLKQGTH